MASLSEDGSVQVMLYSHHDDWDIHDHFAVDLQLHNLPFDGEIVLQHFRIDAAHSNAYAEWVSQGQPTYPVQGAV